MKARPVCLNLQTLGPGINAYTVQKEIAQNGFVNVVLDEGDVARVYADTVRILDTNELEIRGHWHGRGIE